ncbi:MAG: ABC transporter permease [Planctomycetota bacterium]|jgi:ABC-type transport system involved in multi-copper enzyme maturation permease subunit
MTTALADFVRQFASLSWLTGPIFDKELRVSSRRKRNYVLRSAYLALLTLFLVLICFRAVSYSGSALFRTSRMAEAGKAVVTFIVWFQFCALQFVAVVMLSTAISDEIYNHTLGLLMTTPISSFQIVMGKLLSRLLHVMLLMAVSLPLLVITRLFGGVPWDYVISSLCITLTTVIFVASLSLFFSIFLHRAHVVIIMTILTAAALFAVVPFLMPFLASVIWDFMPFDLQSIISKSTLTVLFFHPNPYITFFINTLSMLEPRAMAGIAFFCWPLHCAIMLAASALVLTVAVGLVRKVALSQSVGHLDTFELTAPNKKTALEDVPPKVSPASIRRISGPPIIWHQLHTQWSRRHKTTVFVIIAILLVATFIMYGFMAITNRLHDRQVHTLFVIILMGLGMLFTILVPATTITSEKQARSWPLLLTTTLSDNAIVFGKFAGAFCRCLPVWLLLFGHLLFSVLLGLLHPIVIGQMAILVVWVTAFLCCTGLYFSSRFRHNATAVIMNFALAAAVWVLLPVLLVMCCYMAQIRSTWFEALTRACMDANPLFQGYLVVGATLSGGYGTARYKWWGESLDAMESTLFMLAFMLLYMLLAWIFAWRARGRIRRNIF